MKRNLSTASVKCFSFLLCVAINNTLQKCYCFLPRCAQQIYGCLWASTYFHTRKHHSQAIKFRLLVNLLNLEVSLDRLHQWEYSDLTFILFLLEQAAVGIVPSVMWTRTTLDIAVDQGTTPLFDYNMVNAGDHHRHRSHVHASAVQSAVSHILSSCQSC